MTVQRQHPASLTRGEQAPPLVKSAHNGATESENKIHDDAEAQRLGLRGGLVPGVTLYAYLTELMLSLLGHDFLRRGTCQVRFVRPVYEREQVTCTATLTTEGADPEAGPVSFDLAVLGPDGNACAIGMAFLDLSASAPAGHAEARDKSTEGVDAAARPALTRVSAPIGVALVPRTVRIDAEAVAAYADEVADPNPWYRSGSPFGLPLVSPGLLAGQPARLLRQNFSFGPSIHTASEIEHLALPLAGGDYYVGAQLAETFTKRGNDYLVADVWLHDHNDMPVMRIRHTSIFRFAARG